MSQIEWGEPHGSALLPGDFCEEPLRRCDERWTALLSIFPQESSCRGGCLNADSSSDYCAHSATNTWRISLRRRRKPGSLFKKVPPEKKA
jgi:hypothetical protein